MTDYEIAKEREDAARRALLALDEVRLIMLELVPDCLTSADFDQINSLKKQLNELYDRLKSAPEYGLPTSLADLKFDDLFPKEGQ